MLQMLVHGIRAYAGRERVRKTHNAQMLGATESKQKFRKEEGCDKPEQGISSAENIGDKANSSLDRRPQQQIDTCLLAKFEPNERLG